MKKGLKLLVAEDNLLDQMYYCRMAKDESFNLTIVNSVRAIKEHFVHDSFDVIISKYNLEDGTIFDLLDNRVKKPMILAAHPGEEEIASKAMKRGAANYIMKSIDRNYFNELPEIINQSIEALNSKDRNGIKRNKEPLIVADAHAHESYIETKINTISLNR